MAELGKNTPEVQRGVLPSSRKLKCEKRSYCQAQRKPGTSEG